MKRNQFVEKSLVPHKLLVLAVAALFSGGAHGQATVDPETQPFMTLAPYVLKSTNLEPRIGNEEGGTRAYRPWFENGAWTGDLIEYVITKDGVRIPRDDIGRYPRDGEDWRGSSPLWSARYSFPDFLPYAAAQEEDENWECAEEDPEYWKGRNLFTGLPATTPPQVPLLWDRLSTAQREAVDSIAADNELLDNDPYGSLVLNYVRGDRSNERCKLDGEAWRMRFSLLGAIINSRPVYVPAGDDGLVVVGANSGMVHGFSAADGKEQFGYVPSMILDKIGLIRSDAQIRPGYLVDGELRHRDVGSIAEPRHIVAGGLGAGGKGLFILDVTNTPSLVRELAGVDAPHNNGSYNSAIGYVHGRPSIAKLPDASDDGSSWYVVSGNGYESDLDIPGLVLVPLSGNSAPIIIPVPDSSPNNGLSTPALVDTTGNGLVDYAYAGDLTGKLWRFDLKNLSVSLLFNAGPGRAITVEPDIARQPATLDGFMIYFGTGSLLSAEDIRDTTQQSFFGVWDRGNGNQVQANRLVPRELVTALSVPWTAPEGSLCAQPVTGTFESSVRFIRPATGPDWSDASPDLGWRVDFPANSGERLLGRPQVRAERIQFITTNPIDMATARPPGQEPAPGTGSWILQLDLETGGNAKDARALFDLNKNCSLDPGDGLPATTNVEGIDAGAFPVGVNLGPYNIAQPAFARVSFNTTLRSVVDGVYINALDLPAEDPPSQRPDGPIDVTTDSPFGPAHRDVWPEPAKEPFGLRGLPEASSPTKPFLRADGLGHRVDGHSFGYNKHHGVHFVDLFQLEPRRGELRLDVGTMYWDDVENEFKPIAPRISERELNKVTEVGIDQANQRFIVMITNADLSQDNEIQIGCRTWRVYDYQTTMMASLRKWYTNPQVAMNELDAKGLIFTINGSYNPILQAQGCSEPTIRITPTELVSLPGTLVATLPGCVNNTDRYRGPKGTGYRQTRKPNLQPSDVADPVDLYKTDPHATANDLWITSHKGRRWRNGALTVQILAVNSDNSSGFSLVDQKDLPVGTGQEGIDLGFGGAYAKAFNIPTSGSNRNTVIPLTDGLSVPETATSGMLYELSMFWHWGDMTRLQQEGVGNRTPICYGGDKGGNVIMYESDWFAKYKNVTKDFDEDLQILYISLLAKLLSSDQEVVLKAIEDLEALFEQHKWLRDYHRVRHHAFHNHQHSNELIMIDRGGVDLNLAVDGTPVDVLDIERDLLPSLGPNYQPGRRSWMDLTPED